MYHGPMGIQVNRTAHVQSGDGYQIDLRDVEIEWDTDRSGIAIKSSGAPGFRHNGRSRFDYTILIPPRECALILQTLANAVLQKGVES